MCIYKANHLLSEKFKSQETYQFLTMKSELLDQTEAAVTTGGLGTRTKWIISTVHISTHIYTYLHESYLCIFIQKAVQQSAAIFIQADNAHYATVNDFRKSNSDSSYQVESRPMFIMWRVGLCLLGG